jgi:hypothetical protein
MSAVVRDWWGPQRQTRAGYQDVKECRRRHSLDLAQSRIELLGASGPVEYRDWDNQMKGNNSLINELEVLNQPPFIWLLMDSKNSSVIEACAFH